jgi:hypothetical protein
MKIVNSNTQALLLLSVLTSLSIAATVCPKPTDFGACGIQNQNATVANGCQSTTGGYYTAKEVKCADSGATHMCNNNWQVAVSVYTTYTSARGTNDQGQAVTNCTSTLSPISPNPSYSDPYSCGAATLTSSTCTQGS